MKKTVWITLLVAALGIFSASASIIVSGDITDNFSTFTLQISEDITFDVVNSGDVYILAFDEWVASDGGPQVNPYDNPDAYLMMQVNDGSVNPYSIESLSDNFDSDFGDMTANDGYIYLDDSLSVLMGNTVTIKAATYTFKGLEGFNEDAIGTFSGNVFLANATGNRLSTSEAVPEPATAGLLGISVGALWLIRRLKKAANYYRS